MRRLLLSSMLVLLVLAGCSSTANVPAKIEGGSVNSPLDQNHPGQDMFFTIAVQKDGDPIGVYYHAVVSKGSLRAQLLDPGGKTIWSETAQQGGFAFNTTITETQAGNYKLGIVWDGEVQAQYSLVWKPHTVEVPTVLPQALLGGLGMLLVGLGFCLYALFKRLGWKYLLLGTAFWLVTVACKFAWAIAANGTVYDLLNGALGGLSIWVFSFYVGALTGVFEVVLTYLVLRYTRLGRANWGRALAFGIGFGGFEAILLGLNSLTMTIIGLSTPNLFPPDALASIAMLNNPMFALAPVWERFFTIWVHILSNVLIFYAVAVRKPGWFWLAFIFKTLIDSVAGYAQVSGVLAGTGQTVVLNIWIIEVVIALFGIAGVVGTRWIGERYPGQPASAAAEPATPQAALA